MRATLILFILVALIEAPAADDSIGMPVDPALTVPNSAQVDVDESRRSTAIATTGTVARQIIVATGLAAGSYMASSLIAHRTIAHASHNLAVLSRTALATCLAGELVYRMGGVKDPARRKRAISGAMLASLLAVDQRASHRPSTEHAARSRAVSGLVPVGGSYVVCRGCPRPAR